MIGSNPKRNAGISVLLGLALVPIWLSAVGCHREEYSDVAPEVLAASNQEQLGSLREFDGTLALLQTRMRWRSSSARFTVLNAHEARLDLPATEIAHAAKPARVALPLAGSGQAHIEDVTSGIGLSFSLRGAKPVPLAEKDGAAIYADVLGRGAHSIYRGHAEGVEDWVLFHKQPEMEKLVYDLHVPSRGGLRLVHSTLEILDESGIPRLRVVAPRGIDHEGKTIETALSVGPGCVYDTSPRSPVNRPIKPPCSSELKTSCACEVIVQWKAEAAQYPVAIDPAWTTTGSMVYPRRTHSASLWRDSQDRAYVLVAGGWTDVPSNREIAASELYDIATGVWMMADDLNIARNNHRSVLLEGDGRVLVMGGQIAPAHEYTATAELYDGQWTTIESMSVPRCQHSATLLANGTVLVAGGSRSNFDDNNSVETFDLVTGWKMAQSMHDKRAGHSALALPGNKVIVIGGDRKEVSTVEQYDVLTNSWTSLANLAAKRRGHTAHLLLNGDVLVIGGSNDDPDADILAKSEILPNGSAGPWLPGPLTASPRYGHSGVTFADGNVFVVGGNSLSKRLATAEVTHTGSGEIKFLAAGKMVEAREWTTSTLLPDGRVLVVGGEMDSSLTATAELFERQPASATCSEPGECVSGTCADGICCNEFCEGPCRTCQTGTCAPVEENPCIPYVCSDGSECLETCQSSSDCATDHACVDGTCVFSPDGVKDCTLNPCSPYACTIGQPCPEACSSTAHCADGFRCIEGQCLSHVSIVDSPDGCSCSTVIDRGNALSFASILAVFLASIVRRTRKDRR